MHSVLRTALNAFTLLNLLIFVQSQDFDFNVITDQYLDIYQLYERYSILIPGESIVNNINSPEECAKNCYLTPDIACRSFQYCDSTKTCSLYEEHALNLKVGTEVKTDVDTTCDLYSSTSYLPDFYNGSRNCIANLNFTVINKTTIECAQECYTMKEKCNSFNMYLYVDEPDSTDLTRCTFTELKPSTYYKTETTLNCVNYEKKDKPEDNRQKPIILPGGDDGISQNTITTFIILGAVIGVAMVFILTMLLRKPVQNCMK